MSYLNNVLASFFLIFTGKLFGIISIPHLTTKKPSFSEFEFYFFIFHFICLIILLRTVS